MKLAKYVACICEGAAESAIIDIFVDNELLVFNEGKYKQFNGLKLSPSDFCKTILHMSNVKSYDFVSNYFSNPNILVNSIIEYHKNKNILKGNIVFTICL